MWTQYGKPIQTHINHTNNVISMKFDERQQKITDIHRTNITVDISGNSVAQAQHRKGSSRQIADLIHQEIQSQSPFSRTFV